MRTYWLMYRHRIYALFKKNIECKFNLLVKRNTLSVRDLSLEVN